MLPQAYQLTINRALNQPTRPNVMSATHLQVYVSDANSTAYQYPMVDAKVFRDASGAVAAEVPLVSALAGTACTECKWACRKQQHYVLATLGSGVLLAGHTRFS
jgi:hypothetical protein